MYSEKRNHQVGFEECVDRKEKGCGREIYHRLFGDGLF